MSETEPTVPETRLWELADGITLAIQVASDGVAHFALPPSVLAQLDRIEAMLEGLMPKKEAEPGVDADYISRYIKEAEPECWPVSIGQMPDGEIVISTPAAVSADTRVWLNSQFSREFVFSPLESPR